MATKAVAEFGVFAVKEEALFKAFDRSHHQACTHDLFDRVGLSESVRHPVGAEQFGVGEEFFEEELFAEHGPKGEFVASGLLVGAVGVEQLSAGGNDAWILKALSQGGYCSGFGEAIRIEEEGYVAGHSIEALVVGGAESAVAGVFDEGNAGESAFDFLWSAIL